MIWSWVTFATGYILGGISGILVLGIFIVGSRGESTTEAAIPPETKNHNSVVKFDLTQNARMTGPALRHPPDQPA
jgi:hypothetical protein